MSTKHLQILKLLAGMVLFVALTACTGSQYTGNILAVEEIVIGLLFIAIVVGILARQLRAPYTVGLVLIGLVLAVGTNFELHIQPDLILGVLIPPLVFEAAFHINLTELRRNLTPILAFAVPGVILTMLLVGWVVAIATKLPLPVALVFGAIVAATDPVAVIALFSKIGAPKRLQVLLEGESLLNDGTAIVLFGLIIHIAVGGQFSLVKSVGDFILVSGGGVVIGVVLGILISQIIERIDDYLIETTLTSILAFGSYLIAEALGVSGVLAVVAAGLINGNVGPQGMSPTTRIVVYNFWEYAGFLANTFIFLLIGLQIDLRVLLDYWQPIIIAIIAVQVARMVTVYGLAWIGRDIPTKWQHVLYWGGLRGAIALALALSLPIELGASRSLLQGMAFGVVLFTLIIQGFSMDPLVRKLHIAERSELREEYERRHARAVAVQASYRHLERLKRNGLISEHTWQALSPLLQDHLQALIEAVKEAIKADPVIEADELDTARREILRAQRSAYTKLMKDRIISVESFTQLVSEVDVALAGQEITYPRSGLTLKESQMPVNRLIIAVIQEQDVENAVSALTNLGLSITRLPSVGGFLGRRNLTLLLGLTKGQEETAVQALSKSCRRRVEYISTPLDGSPLPIPAPMPVSVGGATIFAFDVERYEEI